MAASYLGHGFDIHARRDGSHLPAPRERDRAERGRVPRVRAVRARLDAQRLPQRRQGEDEQVARQLRQPRDVFARNDPEALRYLLLDRALPRAALVRHREDGATASSCSPASTRPSGASTTSTGRSSASRRTTTPGEADPQGSKSWPAYRAVIDAARERSARRARRRPQHARRARRARRARQGGQRALRPCCRSARRTRRSCARVPSSRARRAKRLVASTGVLGLLGTRRPCTRAHASAPARRAQAHRRRHRGEARASAPRPAKRRTSPAPTQLRAELAALGVEVADSPEGSTSVGERVARAWTRARAAARSDADEEAVREVALELGAQHLVGRGLDVVLDALELEALRVAVVDRVARAVVVVARLADRADADDVPLSGSSAKSMTGSSSTLSASGRRPCRGASGR